MATLLLVVTSCLQPASISSTRIVTACDDEVRRKVACDHLAPELADHVRDICQRSYSCSATFIRPEARRVYEDCERRAPCSVDCWKEVGIRVAPLPQEIAFANSCRSFEATCDLHCDQLVAGNRMYVPTFWDGMADCLRAPGCGEPNGCLSSASNRPLQALACVF
jgi:hypothetical protein